MSPEIEYMKRSVSAATRKGPFSDSCDMRSIISGPEGDEKRVMLLKGSVRLACLRLKKRERGEVLKCGL